MNKMSNNLFSLNEVLNIEANSKKSVWVLAPDIVLGPEAFKPIMINNLKSRDIEYKYLVSGNSEVLENLFVFVKKLKHEQALTNFNLKIISELIIESDITIIDANTPDEIAFILAPCESPNHHYQITGSALFRIKYRFSVLWSMADNVEIHDELSYPLESNIYDRSFCSEAWRQDLMNRSLSRFSKWIKLGERIVSNSSTSDDANSKIRLAQRLIDHYLKLNGLFPPFESINFPTDISPTIRILIKEVISCHLCGAYSASIGICGKILETALKCYLQLQSYDNFNEQMGLGKLISVVVNRFGLNLDEGLKILVNFINQYRIIGVHAKKGFEIPTNEQSLAVTFVTYDTLRKLYGRIE